MKRSDIALLLAMAAIAGTGPKVRQAKPIPKTSEPDDAVFQKETIAKAKRKRERKKFTAGMNETRTEYNRLKAKVK